MVEGEVCGGIVDIPKALVAGLYIAAYRVSARKDARGVCFSPSPRIGIL